MLIKTDISSDFLNLFSKIFENETLEGGNRLNAVSYTHLDVYKRQEMYRKEKDTAVCCEVMTFVKQYDHSADHDFNALQELLKVAIKEMKSKPKKKHIDSLQKYYTRCV